MIYNPSEGIPASRKSIDLCTRKGNKIQNSQLLELINDAHFKKQINDLKSKYLSIQPRPNTISGIYNCHGMTFACRRTGIELSEELNKIIAEDNYLEISNFSDILAGDIVLYYSESGEIEHSGIIIRSPENIKQISSTTVISKWGSGFEVIHQLYNCPYEGRYVKFYRCFN
jgi:hypothetical protein